MAELGMDVGLYLVEKGLAQALGVDVFINARPDQPDNLISIFDTGGYPASEAIPDLRRTVQITVRNKTHQGAYGLIWDVFTALDIPRARVLIIGGRKARVRALQPPTFLGPDASNRISFVFNLEIVTGRD